MDVKIIAFPQRSRPTNTKTNEPANVARSEQPTKTNKQANKKNQNKQAQSKETTTKQTWPGLSEIAGTAEQLERARRPLCLDC